MKFRMVGPQDEDVKWLWDYCFEKKENIFFQWYFSKYCQEGNVLAGYSGGKMAACLHLIPCDLVLRGQTHPVSYIVGLGVKPEARGGSAGALLQGALEEMRRRQHWISIIMPARASTYYPYQWELCYHLYRYSVALEDLANIGKKWGRFRLFDTSMDYSELDRVYRQFVAGKHGFSVRSMQYWKHIVEEHQIADGYLYLLENEKKVEGYIFYKFHQGKILVREMAYTCREAMLSLVRFLSQHRSQAKVGEWNAPKDDWLHFVLPDPKQVVTLVPFMSARIVDVPQVLAALHYPEGIDTDVVLEIEDELAPWNNGLFALGVSAKTGVVTKLEQRPEAAIRLSVGSLTQLVFGHLNCKDLVAMGRIHCEDQSMLARLDPLFPKCNNYINEYY